MKKVLLVMFVALIAVSAVFAEFNKEDFNLDARVGYYYVDAGVSYDYEKFNFGVDSYFTVGGWNSTVGSISYDVVDTEKSNLSLGAFADVYTDSPFGYEFGAVAEYAYKFDAHNAITARVLLPVVDYPGIENYVFGLFFNGYATIGYRYSF